MREDFGERGGVGWRGWGEVVGGDLLMGRRGQFLHGVCDAVEMTEVEWRMLRAWVRIEKLARRNGILGDHAFEVGGLRES